MAWCVRVRATRSEPWLGRQFAKPEGFDDKNDVAKARSGRLQHGKGGAAWVCQTEDDVVAAAGISLATAGVRVRVAASIGVDIAR